MSVQCPCCHSILTLSEIAHDKCDNCGANYVLSLPAEAGSRRYRERGGESSEQHGSSNIFFKLGVLWFGSFFGWTLVTSTILLATVPPLVGCFWLLLLPIIGSVLLIGLLLFSLGIIWSIAQFFLERQWSRKIHEE